MTINIFEGARRVAKVVGVLWAVGVCAKVALHFEPGITIRYEVNGLDYIPIPRSEHETCLDLPAQSGRELTTKKGTDVFVMLCFKEHTADNGQTGMIPVRWDPTGKYWMMARTYSQEGADYRSRVAREFVLPKADEEWADGRWWSLRLDSLGYAVLLVGGFWAILWVLVKVVGWIARGFLGIPGRDRGVEKG